MISKDRMEQSLRYLAETDEGKAALEDIKNDRSRTMDSPYALAAANSRNNVTYWTGEYTDAGRPAVIMNPDKARHFSCAREAYWEGAKAKGVGYFRAVRVYYTPSKDGFKNFWWLPEEDDEDGYE